MRKLCLLLPLALLAGCGGSSSAPPTVAVYPTSTPIPTPTAVPKSALTAVITGVVANARTGKGIPGATVSLGNRRNATRTDAGGRYRLPIPSGRSASVFVSAPGYTGTLAVGRVVAHSTTRVDFKLNRQTAGRPNVPPLPGTFGKP